LIPLVRVWLLPSLYLPTAVNWAVSPTGIDPLTEFTAMETKAADPTLTVPVALILPWVAVITVEPFDIAVISPTFEIDATAGVETVHATELLRFWVLPSL
jgi:hypothetical protein